MSRRVLIYVQHLLGIGHVRRMVLVVPQAAGLWSDFGDASQAAGNMRAAIGAFEQVMLLAPSSDVSAKAEMALQSLRKKLN